MHRQHGSYEWLVIDFDDERLLLSDQSRLPRSMATSILRARELVFGRLSPSSTVAKPEIIAGMRHTHWLLVAAVRNRAVDQTEASSQL
jgi:hypothetical protein